MKAVAPLLGSVILTLTPPAAQSRLDAPSAVVEVSPPVVREAAETFDVPINEVKQGSLRVFVPDSCILEEEVDLVIHFHGVPTVFAKALRETGMNAVIAVENLGVLSKAYRGRYHYGPSFEFLKQRIIQLVNQACPGNEHHPRRIALSAWSAGYAAVQDILSDNERTASIDAVLLSDGIHTAFIHERLRDLPDNALASFVRFAKHAVESDKFMVITHSEVPTDGYASTTESTNFVLEKLHLERQPSNKAELVAGMRETSTVHAGKLTIRGFSGGDEAAHAAQLHAVRDTLLAPLQKHWETTPAPITKDKPRNDSPIEVTVEVNDNELCTMVGTYVECRTEPGGAGTKQEDLQR